MLWEPVNEGFAVEGTGATSDTMKRLEDVFGSAPIELNPCHTFALRAMGAASNLKAYENLADIIDKHGSIRVYGRY